MADDKLQLEKGTLPDEERLARSGYPPYVGAARYADGYSNDYSLEGGSIQPQLQEVWRRIRKHKWLIFFLSLIVTTIVTIEVFRTKSVYQATATMEIEKENHTLFRSGDVVIESEESDYGLYVTTAMKTKIRLLQSRPLLEDVVVALKLDQNPRFLDVTERKSIWEAVKTISSRIGKSNSLTAPVPVAEAPDVQSENRVARS